MRRCAPYTATVGRCVLAISGCSQAAAAPTAVRTPKATLHAVAARSRAQLSSATRMVTPPPTQRQQPYAARAKNASLDDKLDRSETTTAQGRLSLPMGSGRHLVVVCRAT